MTARSDTSTRAEIDIRHVSTPTDASPDSSAPPRSDTSPPSNPADASDPPARENKLETTVDDVVEKSGSADEGPSKHGLVNGVEPLTPDLHPPEDPVEQQVAEKDVIPKDEYQEAAPESAAGTPAPPVEPAESCAHQYNARLENTQIFLKAFQDIAECREVKKNNALAGATLRAVEVLRANDPQGVPTIFESLKVLCGAGSQDLKSKAVDVFAKLFDYTVFEDQRDLARLTDASVEVILSCFEGEGTDEKLEVQVVKALVQCILCMPTHGLSLLNAVRQIFNVMIMSLSQDNQGLAQGLLTQVIGAVFQRVSELAQRKRSGAQTPPSAADEDSESGDKTVAEDANAQLTLEQLQNLVGDHADAQRTHDASVAPATNDDWAVKDAFLIFRVICKLASKDLDADNVDMKSHAARQKMFTLHLIHTVLKDYIDIFLSEDVVILFSQSKKTRLVDAVRPELLQALSRNATLSLAPVFELSIEIFWLLVSNLRSDFKQEIAIFLDTIYFPIGEIKTSTAHHKRYLLAVIERVCNDLRCLIEFYLNYDCVSKMPDICDMVIHYLTKLALARVDVTPAQQAAYMEKQRQGIALYDITKIGELNSARISSRPPEPDVYAFFPVEYALKVTSLNCFVAFLRSLHSWAQRGLGAGKHSPRPMQAASVPSVSSQKSSANSRSAPFVGTLGADDNGDYEQFESQKQRKKLFSDGVRQFAQKPAKAVQFFIEQGFIPSELTEDIAAFLRDNDALDKAAIGEYLGGTNAGPLRNAFFSTLNFAGVSFVDALRSFLQLFRLPGEGQKVDRYMQNFAERYVDGNPHVFQDASDAYILAYSTTMLNTDQHSKSLKSRMTLEDFVNMNSGSDYNIPRVILEQVFHEIQQNEIKLLSEQQAAAITNDGSSVGVGLFSGRNVVREAYLHASREMSSKTEMLVRSIGRRPRNSSDEYHVASTVAQVRAIFNQVWMSVLAGLTGPFKEYDDAEVVHACLKGLKFAIKIAGLFGPDDAQKAFVNALIQFQSLANVEDIRAKNVDAMYLTLDIAISEGNRLHNLWYAVLALVSQLERLQLIASGIDQDTIPDVSAARLLLQPLGDASARNSGFFGFVRELSASEAAASRHHSQQLSSEAAALVGRTELSVAIDRVFTNTSELSGDAINDFVGALRQVVTEEIESSALAASPRLFSLQKVVDICYYNMGRVRFEWIPLWATLGDIFNSVGCHANLTIDFFALDSLKQLSMRFLSIEELAHFKFQREFLRPFHHIIVHNPAAEAKEMVLDCINNMVMAKADHIKSGWKTVLEVLAAAAAQPDRALVPKAFDMAVRVRNDHFAGVRAQDSVGDLVACFTAFAKNEHFQKFGLLSVEILTKLLTQVAHVLGDRRVDAMSKLWFPVLLGFHDIIMNGEELEVRLLTLTRFFDVLHQYGSHFDARFWDVIYRQLVAQIFGVLSEPWGIHAADVDLCAENDRMSFWVSTTLVQALNSLVSLYTHYFDAFQPLLDELLALLTNCICQDNDTIAKTGKVCLEEFILRNAKRLSEEQWVLVVNSFAGLFELTTARGLLEETGKEGMTEGKAEGEQKFETRTRDKNIFVLQCIRQLMLIETVLELTKQGAFSDLISDAQLIRLAQFLFDSHQFARTFNDNLELRKRLYTQGIIERLPTLLKQETISAAVFLNVMFRLYSDDTRATDAQTKQTILASVVPLSTSIVQRYCAYSETNQPTYILAWRNVIREIFEGYVELDAPDFAAHAPVLFDWAMRANNRSQQPYVHQAVEAFMSRVGDIFVHARGETNAPVIL